MSDRTDQLAARMGLPSALIEAARARNPQIGLEFEQEEGTGIVVLVVTAGKRTLRAKRPPGNSWKQVFHHLELL